MNRLLVLFLLTSCGQNEAKNDFKDNLIEYYVKTEDSCYSIVNSYVEETNQFKRVVNSKKGLKLVTFQERTMNGKEIIHYPFDEVIYFLETKEGNGINYDDNEQIMISFNLIKKETRIRKLNSSCKCDFLIKQ